MDSYIVRINEGWAVRLMDVGLERPFHYKKDALALQKELSTMSKWQVKNTYTLVENHYFRSYPF